MNGHFNLCPDCDFFKLYTEISSLTRIFHEKAALIGSWVSFIENRGPIHNTKEKGNAQKNNQENKKAHSLNHPDFLVFSVFLNEWAFYPMNLRDFLILYTEISTLYWIFHENTPVARSRVSFIGNRGSIKSIKEMGQRWICFQNSYFDHNSAPTGAEVSEIKTSPPESIIF